MDNNVCKIGTFIPFQGCVTYSNANIMSNNVNVTTTATKPLYPATFFQGVQRLQRGVAFRAKHPSNPNYPE